MIAALAKRRLLSGIMVLTSPRTGTGLRGEKGGLSAKLLLWVLRCLRPIDVLDALLAGTEQLLFEATLFISLQLGVRRDLSATEVVARVAENFVLTPIVVSVFQRL